MSARPSVSPSSWKNSASTGQIFKKFDISVFFEKLPRKLKFYSNRTHINGTLHEDQYIFLIISRSVLLRTKVLTDKVVEKIEKYVLGSVTSF
jgi:hypothetical protein